MGKPMRAAISSMLARRRGSGNGMTRKVSSASQVALPPTATEALVMANPEPSCSSVAVIDRSWPGMTKERSFASLTAARNGIRSNLVAAITSQPEVCAIASIKSTPGISGWPGKCPSKIVLSCGTCASTRIVRPSRSRSTIRSMSWKYSMRMELAHVPAKWAPVRRQEHAPSHRLSPLGGDQTVDAGTQVLEDEVLLGGRLAVVDFLRPLLERELDSERLVDRECDIEEIEAVDAEIVDRVAFRLDLLARNVARLGDDIGDRIEG